MKKDSVTVKSTAAHLQATFDYVSLKKKPSPKGSSSKHNCLSSLGDPNTANIYPPFHSPCGLFIHAKPSLRIVSQKKIAVQGFLHVKLFFFIINTEIDCSMNRD